MGIKGGQDLVERGGAFLAMRAVGIALFPFSASSAAVFSLGKLKGAEARFAEEEALFFCKSGAVGADPGEE